MKEVVYLHIARDALLAEDERSTAVVDARRQPTELRVEATQPGGQEHLLIWHRLAYLHPGASLYVPVRTYNTHPSTDAPSISLSEAGRDLLLFSRKEADILCIYITLLIFFLATTINFLLLICHFYSPTFRKLKWLFTVSLIATLQIIIEEN